MNGYTYTTLLAEYESNPGVFNPITYIREDLETKKVYVATENTENLLYDFGVIEGQSVNVWSIGFMHTLIVTQVETIAILGTYRKVIHYDENGFEGFWIEGMGSVFGVPDPTLYGIADYSPVVTCYYEGNNLAWQNPQTETVCGEQLAVPNIEVVPQFSILPNPASDQFSLLCDRQLHGKPCILSILSSDVTWCEKKNSLLTIALYFHWRASIRESIQ